MPLPETLLSVLIVNFNTRLLTCQCLRSLLPEARALGAQVIVVDNGSTDGSPEAIGAEFPEVEVMALDGNLGFGAANNRAAARSAARYLLLLNSDTIMHTGALRALIDCANVYSDAGAVGAGGATFDSDAGAADSGGEVFDSVLGVMPASPPEFDPPVPVPSCSLVL